MKQSHKFRVTSHRHTPPTHTHTVSEMGHNFPLVHATHSLTLINDLYPPNSPYSLPGSSHIKFSTRKPETVQAKAAFYVRRRRMREGGWQGSRGYYGFRMHSWLENCCCSLNRELWSLKWKFASERKLSTANRHDREREKEREKKGKREREGQG